MRAGRNSEGYSDPTASQAISSVLKAIRMKAKGKSYKGYKDYIRCFEDFEEKQREGEKKMQMRELAKMLDVEMGRNYEVADGSGVYTVVFRDSGLYMRVRHLPEPVIADTTLRRLITGEAVVVRV